MEEPLALMLYSFDLPINCLLASCDEFAGWLG
jgi:hypothetical protein